MSLYGQGYVGYASEFEPTAKGTSGQTYISNKSFLCSDKNSTFAKQTAHDGNEARQLTLPVLCPLHTIRTVDIFYPPLNKPMRNSYCYIISVTQLDSPHSHTHPTQT